MSGNQARFQAAMKQGHSAAWEQLWPKAIDYYRQALQEFPTHPNALNSLGLALYEMQNYKEALLCYQKAVEVSPTDPVPLEKVAELHERLGNYSQVIDVSMRVAELYAQGRDMPKAIESWTRVIRINPVHLMAHSRLALVYERLGRKQQSITEFLVVASLLQDAGDVQRAIQTVMHALQVMPESREATQALNMIKSGQRLPKPAGPRAVAEPPPASNARRLEDTVARELTKTNLTPIAEACQRALSDLAGLLFEQDEEEEEGEQAKRIGMAAIVKGTGPLGIKQSKQTKIILHVSQAIDMQARNENVQAKEELTRAVETGLDHPAAYFYLGYLLAGSGQNEDAIQYLERAVSHPSYQIAARLLLGQILFKMERLQEAALECMEALRYADMQIVPNDQADGLSQLYDPLVESLAQQTPEYYSSIYTNVNDMLMKDGWRESLLRARQQLPSPGTGGPLVPLAELLTESRGGKVIEFIAKIHQLSRAGYIRAAMDEAFFALEYAPTYLPLHTYIGELLLQQRRTQAAVDKFFTVAQSYSSRGEARRAVEMYRRVIDLVPMDLNVHNNLIEQLVAMGKPEEAIAEYNNLAEVYYNLADLVQARKTYQEAFHLAHQSNIDKEVKGQILHRIADIDLQSLDWRQAVRVLEQIRTMLPDDESARTSLIELNLRLNQSPQAMAELDDYIFYLCDNNQRGKGIAHLKNLINENPKQPAIRRRLAELYRQNGQTAEAILQLDVAGDLLVKAGDKTGAIETIMAILALNPPNAAEYQRVLAKLNVA